MAILDARQLAAVGLDVVAGGGQLDALAGRQLLGGGLLGGAGRRGGAGRGGGGLAALDAFHLRAGLAVLAALDAFLRPLAAVEGIAVEAVKVEPVVASSTLSTPASSSRCSTWWPAPRR